MTRVSSLYQDKILNKQKTDILTNLNIKQQLDLISNKTQKLFKLSDKIYFFRNNKHFFGHFGFRITAKYGISRKLQILYAA